MITIFIIIAFIAIRCVVDTSTGGVACATSNFTNVGATLAAGAEILFEMVGVITIIRKKGKG